MRIHIGKAQAEGFRIHAIWETAEAGRLFGAQAAHYLRDVEHGLVILTGSEDAAQALARADRVRELIKVEVAASAPAGEVVAR
jgi:hypothetical protein